MIKNITYNNPEIQKEIDALVGKSYTLIQRIKMKGTGSARHQIMECSSEIHALLQLDNNTNVCSIEIRPRGVVIHFRSILETFGWAIPYYKLSIYKTDQQHYSMHADQHKIMIKCSQHDFIKRIMDEKLNSSSPAPFEK